MNEILDQNLVPKPPYSSPDNLVKAFSLRINLEEICLQKNLLGLSAPQVGMPWNLFVYWSNYPSEPKIFSCFLDCEYIGSGEKMLSLESCATFGQSRFRVMRYPSVLAKGSELTVDLNGKIKKEILEREFSGVLAAIIQHESDHMSGISLEESGERMFFK